MSGCNSCNMSLQSGVLNRRSPFTFPLDFQLLRINETVLETITSLVRYMNVNLSSASQESTLHLVLRLRGGAKKRKKKSYTTPKKNKHKRKKVKLAVLKYYKVGTVVWDQSESGCPSAALSKVFSCCLTFCTSTGG